MLSSAVARLVTAVVVEAHDEWAVSERRHLSEESMAKLHEQPPATVTNDDTPRRHRLSHTVNVEPLTPAPTYTTPRDAISLTRS